MTDQKTTVDCKGNPSGNAMVDAGQHDRLARFCLDHASACALLLGQDGRILYANRKAGDSLGYAQGDLLKMSVFDIDADEDREMWPHAWEHICRDGSVTIESRHRRQDGTVFPVEVAATLIEFDGQRYSMALITDITERKRTLESLRISQFVFDKAPLGIFLIEDGGRITGVNDHACRYLGYTREELCRMNVRELDRAHSPENIDQIWLRQQQKKTIDIFETVHRRKDGTDIPVEISGIMVEFESVPYSVSFVQDISERKAAEKQRLEMEAHIRETQKIESLGTLAGGIAHDFNNILAAILGYAELAQLKSPEDSSLNQYVSQILQAGLRAKDLVNQILTFSRQGISEKGPRDIGRVVGEALKLIRATVPANIEIIEHIPPNLAPVIADEIQIHQIVMNLCTNAHHAMRATGGRLDVSLNALNIQPQDAPSYPGMNPGTYLKLSVADSGCGIPPTIINRIFDPYYTTKPTGEGTGLGLSTVHGIVRDHGGCIKVYSELGCGTTFHVLLPVADAAVDAVAEQAAQLPTGSEHILFVDDEKSLIDLGRDLLELLGYRVETRASSIDALKAFQVNPQKYDLIVSDMNMPKMTGDELAREIRAIRPDIPIILCSGFSDRMRSPATAAIGISALLMKPVTYVDLARTVRQVLDTRP